VSSIRLNQIGPQRIKELTMIEFAYRRAAVHDATPWMRRSADQRLAPTLQHRLEDRQFLVMQHAFHLTGGMVSGDEMARLLRRHSDQPISMLARWIVAREAVSFEWKSQTLLPLFQFDLSNMSLRPSVTAIVRELADVFDDLPLALWFAEPNAWLADSSPVDVVAVDPAAVLEAARADRFIARG
jgi:hypothetical protein